MSSSQLHACNVLGKAAHKLSWSHFLLQSSCCLRFASFHCCCMSICGLSSELSDSLWNSNQPLYTFHISCDLPSFPLEPRTAGTDFAVAPCDLDRPNSLLRRALFATLANSAKFPHCCFPTIDSCALFPTCWAGRAKQGRQSKGVADNVGS